jgi:hypothetical protein
LISDRFYGEGRYVIDRLTGKCAHFAFGNVDYVAEQFNNGRYDPFGYDWQDAALEPPPEQADEPDMVNQPPHYKFENGVEVIDLTEQLNFNCGNAIKYLARAGRKNVDKTIEDLEKAEYYVKREIERVKRGRT